MNIAAKTMCLIAVSTFCAVGMMASPSQPSEPKPIEQSAEVQELAHCVPKPADYSSLSKLVETRP